ncbi:MAG: OmpH family outer membrane protein [Planctomycetota bacterium]
MQRRRWFAIAALMVVSLLWLGIERGDGQPAGASASGALRIGVVHMERAFQNSKQKATLEAELEKKLRDRLSELEKLEGDIKRAQQSLALLESGSPDHAKGQEEVAQKQAILKVRDERFRAQLQRVRMASFDQIYAEIRDVTAQVAAELQLDLVFQKTLTIDEKMPAWESVLYARPNFDVTEAVLLKLNAK